MKVLEIETGKITERRGLAGKERGWGIYPPLYLENKLYLIMTGEEEDEEKPDVIEYPLE